MTIKSQNTENEQQNNLCTTLTEQWKKGKLEIGQYYIKYKGVYISDKWYGNCWKHGWNEYVEEVLAPVPDYEEWRRLQSSWVDEMGKVVDLQKALEWSNEQYNTKVPVLESENQQLKTQIAKLTEVVGVLPSNHSVGNLGYKIKNQRHEINNRLKEIDKLKELLRECKTPIDLLIKMNIDGINGYELLDLLIKIDNAIGGK